MDRAKLSEPNILLTGGTGFFGRALLRHWFLGGTASVPMSVTVLSRSPQSFLARFPEFHAHPNLRFVNGDILDLGSFPAGERFTHVLHAAADSTNGPALSPLERFDQIVTGTRNVLRYCANGKISRMLFTSSGGVYGPQPAHIEFIPENYTGMPDPLRAEHAYSVAKRCAEHLCALYASGNGIEVVIARCFAFVGRDLPLDVHFAIGNFIRDALFSDRIVVSGDGFPVRSYMDQRDLALWLHSLLLHGRAGQAYNVGSDVALSVGELAKLVQRVIAPEKEVHILGSSVVGTFRNRYIPSITKANSELGLRLQYTLEESVREVARFARRTDS